jgi:protein TonB
MTDVDVLDDPLLSHPKESVEWQLGTVGTILLHVGVALAYVVASRITPTHRFISPQAVAVRLVPLSSVPGTRPEPAAAPEPSRPVIEKAEEAPKPSPKALPLPEKKPEKKQPPSVHPSQVSPKATKKVSAPVDLPSSGEASGGAGPAGPASTFGTSLSAFDAADFNYSYYVSQMLAAIGANWFKPTDQSVSAPVVFFRIARDGSISDVRIERSSGLPFVDRAAQRAVMAASPLAPLPADFHESSLGVHLKFE